MRRGGSAAITLAIVMLVIGPVLVVLAVVLPIHDSADSRRQHELERYGVQTSGTVESESFDINGGDPGGWTTIVVRFLDTHGQSHVVTVGHHGPATETAGALVSVLYDSRNPAVATWARDPFPSAVGRGLSIGFGTGFGVAGLALVAGGIVMLTPKRQSPETVET